MVSGIKLRTSETEAIGSGVFFSPSASPLVVVLGAPASGVSMFFVSGEADDVMKTCCIVGLVLPVDYCCLAVVVVRQIKRMTN